ncbi:hypothetical protein NBRC116188_07940 [Oceaniserpentilla sp. 4NH20-0058]
MVLPFSSPEPQALRIKGSKTSAVKRFIDVLNVIKIDRAILSADGLFADATYCRTFQMDNIQQECEC